jgi:hypothetical protein
MAVQDFDRRRDEVRREAIADFLDQLMLGAAAPTLPPADRVAMADTLMRVVLRLRGLRLTRPPGHDPRETA